MVNQMFKCENKYCQKQVQPGQPENRIITERRDKTYRNTYKKGRDERVKMTEGSEIVKEARVCPLCYQKLTGQQPNLLVPKPSRSVVPLNKDRRGGRPLRKQKWTNPRRKHIRNDTSIPAKKPIVEIVNPLKIIKE